MGAGRSGSTILGVALGNCDGFFFAGELDKWLPRSGRPRLQDDRRVDFWRSVRERVSEDDALAGGRTHRYLERSSGLLRIGRLARLRRLRPSYRRTMCELYGAIAATAEATCLVDTSHYPLRARELQALDGIDMFLLLQVRDPRDVIASFARDDVAERSFGPSTTRAYLLLTHLLSAWVFLKHPRARRLVVFHEDLIERPDGVLRSVLEHIGSPARVPDLSSLSTGIPLHGNRLIEEDIVSLEARDAPAHRMRERGSLFALLTIGLLSRLRPRARAAGPSNLDVDGSS